MTRARIVRLLASPRHRDEGRPADVRHRLASGDESPRAGWELGAYCLAFCGELTRDHVLVAEIVARVRDLAGAPGTADRAELLRAVTG